MAALSRRPEMFRKSRQTGTLNLQGMGLTRIPKEVIHPFDHLEKDESSQYVVLLTRLNLQVALLFFLVHCDHATFFYAG